MKDFMRTFSSGFSTINNQYKTLSLGVNALNHKVSAPAPSTAPGFISSQDMYSSSRSGMSSASITVSAPITIHQQPNQDAEELASIVAMKIGEAVADARAASVFV